MSSLRFVAALVALVSFVATPTACDKQQDAQIVSAGAGDAKAEKKEPEMDCVNDWRGCLDKAKDEAYMDKAKGNVWYEKVCNGPVKMTKQGDSTLRGCLEAGRALLKGDAKLKKDVAKGKKYLEKACTGKYAEACADLGGGYQSGEFGAEDIAQAAKYMRQACDLGNEFSCSGAAKLEKLSKYGKKSDWPKLCEAGKGPSCLKLAMEHYKLKHEEGQKQKAAEFFEKACNLKESKGCDVLAQMYQKKWVGEKRTQEAKALEYFGKACDLGCGPCCSDGGAMAHGKKKYALALQNFQKGCDLDGEGARIACASAGQLYLSGRGTKKDLDKARIVLQKACEGGESSACKQVADIDKVKAKAKK